MTENEERNRQVKFQLSEAEHTAINLAAAMHKMSMAEYCRTVVLADAETWTKDIKLPPERKKKPRSSK